MILTRLLWLALALFLVFAGAIAHALWVGWQARSLKPPPPDGPNGPRRT